MRITYINQRNWLYLSLLFAVLVVSIAYGHDDDETVLVANFMNGDTVILIGRIHLFNASDEAGNVTVRVFTLPVSGGTAQELTATPLALGTLGARSALNIRLDIDILTLLGIPLPYTNDGGNLTLEFTIQAEDVTGLAQYFDPTLDFFDSYALQVVDV